MDLNFVIPATFMTGSALAAPAGAMIASEYGIAHFYMGFMTGNVGTSGNMECAWMWGQMRPYRSGEAGAYSRCR